MEDMIRDQGILAMEMRVPYSPVIHNPKAMGSLQYLDGKFCASKLKREVESAIIVSLDMELRWN